MNGWNELPFLLRPKDARRVLGCGRCRLMEMVASGELAGVRTKGGHLRVTKVSVAKLAGLTISGRGGNGL